MSKFITELCSFIELSHFILPQDSFRDFVAFTVCEPFPELSTTIVSQITGFFEIFPSDQSGDEAESLGSSSHKINIKSKSSSDETGVRSNRSLMILQQSKQNDIKENGPSKQVIPPIDGPQIKVEQIKTSIKSLQEKSLSVHSIPLTTQSNLRNHLVSRQKYVGNHFSDNASSLFQEVKMAPRQVVVNHASSNIQKKRPNRVVQESPVKGDNRNDVTRTSAQSQRLDLLRSPSVGVKKDPSKYVAAAMKFRSKSK